MQLFKDADLLRAFMYMALKFNVPSDRQDRQWSYNLTSGCVRVTIIALEKQKVLNILSVCL
jgi:hypothetical protein